ncbi:MAG: nucleotidyltransferase family protein [Bacillota bacterium]|jgi:molybdenum cofactor cytidylyltransferase
MSKEGCPRGKHLSEPPVGVVVLAAGTSSRLGREKQLLPWHGMPLLGHVLRQALGARVSTVVAVLGHNAKGIREAVEPFLGSEERLLWVVNPDYLAKGMSSSLALGVKSLPAGAAGVIFLLGDQPLVRTEHLEALLCPFGAMEDPSRAILAASWADHRCHPVLFGSGFFPELVEVNGDEGARSLIQKYRSCVTEVPVDADTSLDVDTWEDYGRWLETQEDSTPAGGARYDIIYMNEHAEVVDRPRASRAIIREFDREGNVIFETTFALIRHDRQYRGDPQ